MGDNLIFYLHDDKQNYPLSLKQLFDEKFEHYQFETNQLKFNKNIFKNLMKMWFLNFG